MNTSSHGWRTPQNFLLLISIIVPIAFSTWMALLNNFVIEKANFDGADIGLLQSVREIPGFFSLYRRVSVVVYPRTTIHVGVISDANAWYSINRLLSHFVRFTFYDLVDVHWFSLL